MNITLGAHQLYLHSSGVALWREHGLAIVSDLHLEKGSHFAKRGFFIPPYDSHDTLERLLDVCATENVRQLLLLGDCFHDSKGYVRLDAQAKRMFEALECYDPIWIKGNHDKDLVPPNFTPYHSYSLEGLTFVHEAEMGECNEISGHFHPKARIVHKGGVIDRPCFVEDGHKLIMPAFGAYTGGLYIDQPPIADLLQNDVHVHLLGERKVYSFKVA